jgi:hypothetical protein
VQVLRERRKEPGRSLFRAVQQALERAQRGAAADLEQIEAIARLDNRSSFAAVDPVLSRCDRVDARADSGAARHGQSRRNRNGRFQQLADLRGSSRDELFRLGTVSDSRVLLNVYGAVAGHTRLLRRSTPDGYARSTSQHLRWRRIAGRARRRAHPGSRRALSDLKESRCSWCRRKMSSLGQLVAGVVRDQYTAAFRAQQCGRYRQRGGAARGIGHCAVVARLVRDGGAESEVRSALQALGGAIGRMAWSRRSTDQALGRQHGRPQSIELVKNLKDFSRLDRASGIASTSGKGSKTLVMTRACCE